MDCHFDQETKILSRNELPLHIEPKGLGYFMHSNITKHANCVAQINNVTGETELYSTLLKKCRKLAIALKKLNVKPGDIITVCSYNNFNSVVPIIAAQFIGAIASSTDPTISPLDTKHLINLVKPKVIFVSEDSEELIENVLIDIGHKSEIVNFNPTKKYMQLEILLDTTPDDERFELYITKDPNCTAFIHFSSGTTGLPKGICLSHNFFLFNILNAKEVWGTNKVILSFASTYWISTSFLLLTAILNGGARLICKSFNPETIWTDVEKYSVDMLFVAPSQAIRALPYIPEGFKKSPKNVLIGGSSISPTYLEKVKKALPNSFIFQGYGQTEVGITTITHIGHISSQKLTSCGTLLSGLSFKIVDPDTQQAVNLNTPGEIRVKSKYPMNGYFHQDSSDCFDEEGFLKSGDVGYIDEDYCFYITDRIKEMFKYISWHIVPAKLESLLESHPDVQLAAVIGIPHPEDDNHAMGIVVLHKNSKATEEELEKYVEERVDERNRLRAGVKIIDVMPYTPSQKIKKTQLRDMVVQGVIV